MFRLGIVGTDNTHAYQYAGFINGWREDVPIPVRLPSGEPVPAMYEWAQVLREFTNDGSLPGFQRSSQARVTRLWSGQPEDADLLRNACGIDVICDSPEEVARDVDAVLVLSEDPAEHLRHAETALRAGLPTYVDKPMAPDRDTAEKIFAMAREYGAPCFTGSSLRYSEELRSFRQYALARVGTFRGMYVQVPIDNRLYGLHAIEMIDMFLGSDVVRVSGVRSRCRQTVCLEYTDGRTATYETLGYLARPCQNLVINGTHHDVTTQIHGIGLIPADFVHAVLRMLTTREDLPSERAALRFIDIRAAAEEALRTGTPQTIDRAETRS
ncbi:Gfo/Idh/MocA family protein [Amycolatopsis pithecellobii]|nr:Gfo/Idh/MocA family oxidoreductase [Amycolatopsis pithecellobii]